MYETSSVLLKPRRLVLSQETESSCAEDSHFVSKPAISFTQQNYATRMLGTHQWAYIRKPVDKLYPEPSTKAVAAAPLFTVRHQLDKPIVLFSRLKNHHQISPLFRRGRKYWEQSRRNVHKNPPSQDPASCLKYQWGERTHFSS